MGRYLIRLLAVAALYIAAHCAVLWFVRAPIAAEYWVREALIVKRDRIAAVPSPRLILLGGSSTLFAFDPVQMRDALGMPVFNFGIHASMRLEWILAEGSNAARAGDTILVVLEPPYFECATQSWDSWQLRNALAWNRAWLDALPPLDRARALLTGGNVALPVEIARAAMGNPAALIPPRRAAMAAPAEILARVAAAPGAAALLVDRGPVEVAVVGRAVPLRGEDAGLDGRVGGRQPRLEPFDEIEVGFFPGFHDAEFGVDASGRGDDPLRPRLGAALGGGDGRPGRPSLVGTGLDRREGECSQFGGFRVKRPPDAGAARRRPRRRGGRQKARRRRWSRFSPLARGPGRV